MALETATIVGSWTRAFRRHGERQGVRIGPILADAGVDRVALEEPTGRVAFAAHTAFALALGRRLDDPGLGLAVGAAASAADFGVVGLLAESSATLGDALARIHRFNALANEASRMDFWVDGGRVVVTDAHRRDGTPVPDVLAEATLAFYTTVIRASIGVAEPLLEVWLTHRRHRGWSSPRSDHFAARTRFGRPMNALVLPRELLSARLGAARPEIGLQLSAFADRLARDLAPSDDLRMRVAVHVRRTLPDGPPPIERTARALGTSTRSLQRRLEQEGVSYVEIVDDVRRRVVQALLGERELGFDEIAERAGYSDARSLRRATMRWFGSTPAAARRDDAAR